MKVLILPLIAAVVAAEPQLYVNSYHGLPSLVNPLAVNPVVYAQPAQFKPVQTLAYEKIEKEEPVKEEKPVKVDTYALPSIYGQPLLYKTPVVTQKVNVPARFHIKNGKLEHTSINKREAEAEPIFPYSYPMTSYASAISPLAHTVSPAVVPYTAPIASIQSPLVYNSPVAIQTPTVVKQEVEYLKPKVDVEAKTVANDAITPFMYAGKFTYKAENAGAVHVAKREAEAEPLNYFGVSPYAATAYGNILPYASPVKPVVAYSNILPHSQILPYATPLAIKTLADDRLKAEQYASKGQYVAETAGSIHIAKREAEPQRLIPYNTFYQRPVSYVSPLRYTSPIVRTSSYVQTRPIYY